VQPFWGRLADRSGVRPLLIAGGLGALASLALLGALDLLAVAIVTTLTAGLFLAALVAGTSTAAVEAGRTRGMGAYMGLFASAGSAGQALMPLLFGVLLGQLGVDGLLIAVGVLVALASLAYLVSMGLARSTSAAG
jgi:MFS family permease